MSASMKREASSLYVFVSIVASDGYYACARLKWLLPPMSFIHSYKRQPYSKRFFNKRRVEKAVDSGVGPRPYQPRSAQYSLLI